MQNSTSKALLYSFIFTLTALAPSTAMAEESHPCLEIGYFVKTVPADERRFLLKKNLAKKGICINYNFLPTGRTTKMMQDGRLDGELERISSYVETIGKSAFRLDPPINMLIGYLMTKDPKAKSLADLKGATIGINKGYIWHNNFVGNYEHTIAASTPKDIIKLAKRGRMAAFLIASETLELNPALLEGFYATEVTKFNLHFWLRKEHAHHIKAFQAAMKEMVAASN